MSWNHYHGTNYLQRDRQSPPAWPFQSAALGYVSALTPILRSHSRYQDITHADLLLRRSERCEIQALDETKSWIRWLACQLFFIISGHPLSSFYNRSSCHDGMLHSMPIFSPGAQTDQSPQQKKPSVNSLLCIFLRIGPKPGPIRL